MASSRSKTYDYRSVVISLENCIIPKEKLKKTPSVVDGLNIEIETDLRIVGCEYIQTAGILLKLAQVAMATGQVLFQRFYYSKSFVRHDVEVYAMACLFLAAKIEECPRRIRDVINVFHHIKQRRNLRPIVPMEYLGNTYFTLKNLVIKAERRILKELGFCVHVQHPHKVVITFLQVLDCEKNQPLAQLAWNFMNDALRTNVFVRYQPGTIACACIFLSARQLKIPLPSRPPWWGLFDGKSEDIENVCLTLLQLYQRPKNFGAKQKELDKFIHQTKIIVSLQTLNKAVDRLKKILPTKKTNESFSTDAIDDKSKKRSSESTFSQPDDFTRQEEKSRKAMRERIKGEMQRRKKDLGSPSNVSPITEGTKSRSEDVKKNDSNKRESQGSKGTKKSSKSQQTRKDNKNPKPSSRSRSPLSEKSDSASATESDPGDSSDSDSASAESGSSNDDNRKRKEKITRRSRGQVDDRQREKHDDIRSTTGRKLYKSKSDTNSYRRARDRSRSPYRRSRSRSRDRRNPRDKPGRREDRNGDYKITDKYEKRDRSGRR